MECAFLFFRSQINCESCNENQHVGSKARFSIVVPKLIGKRRDVFYKWEIQSIHGSNLFNKYFKPCMPQKWSSNLTFTGVTDPTPKPKISLKNITACVANNSLIGNLNCTISTVEPLKCIGIQHTQGNYIRRTQPSMKPRLTTVGPIEYINGTNNEFEREKKRKKNATEKKKDYKSEQALKVESQDHNDLALFVGQFKGNYYQRKEVDDDYLYGEDKAIFYIKRNRLIPNSMYSLILSIYHGSKAAQNISSTAKYFFKTSWVAKSGGCTLLNPLSSMGIELDSVFTISCRKWENKVCFSIIFIFIFFILH